MFNAKKSYRIHLLVFFFCRAALKDIRHLNRPPSHCRQSLFPGFPVHHNQHQKSEQLAQSRQEQLQKQDQQRQSQMHQASHNSQAFLESQSESMKRETIESRLESENAYIDQMDLSLAAAAAAAAAAAHHHNAANMHHPNSRLHEMENNLHKGMSNGPIWLSNIHFFPIFTSNFIS